MVLFPTNGQCLVSSSFDVGRDVQNLFVTFAFVQVLREAETGASDTGQRLAPTHEIAREVGRRGVIHIDDASRTSQTPAPRANKIARSTSARWSGSSNGTPADVLT